MFNQTRQSAHYSDITHDRKSAKGAASPRFSKRVSFDLALSPEAVVNDPLYEIRTARFDELRALAAIEQRAGMLFESTPHAYVASGPNLALEIVTERWHSGFVLVAAERSDHVVGFALGGKLGHSAYLQEIDVDPAHGRRGLGRRLLREVFRWAKQHRCRSVILSTFANVAWNAPFYRRLGFELIPESEFTAGMRDIRAAEVRSGLVMSSRVLMRATVPRDA